MAPFSSWATSGNTTTLQVHEGTFNYASIDSETETLDPWEALLLLPYILLSSQHHLLALTLKIDPGECSCKSELQARIKAAGRREVEGMLRGDWTQEEREVLQAVAMALEGEYTAALQRIETAKTEGSALARTCAWVASWTWLGQGISDEEWTKAVACAVEDARSFYLLLEFKMLVVFKAGEWDHAYFQLSDLLSLLPETEVLEALVFKLMIWRCCVELHYWLDAQAAARDVATLRNKAGVLPEHLSVLCANATDPQSSIWRILP